MQLQQRSNKRNIVLIVFGIISILAWFPVIISNETKNAKNSNEIGLLKSRLNDKNTKYEEGILSLLDTGNIPVYSVSNNTDSSITQVKQVSSISSNTISFIESYNPEQSYTLFNNETDINKYVFIYQELIITDSEDKSIKTLSGHSNNNIVFIHNNISHNVVNNVEKSYTNSTEHTINNLIGMCSPIPILIKSPIIDNLNTYTYKYYGIINNTQVTKILINWNGINMPTKYYYELGNTETSKNTLIARKDKTNIIHIWLYRLGTFILLCEGFSLVAEPIKHAINTPTSILYRIPVISPFLNFISNIIFIFFDAMSYFGCIVLSMLLSLVVYFVINKSYYSFLAIALLVGVSMYLQN